MRTSWTCALLIVVGTLALVRPVEAGGLQEAVARSKQTGLPMFVIGRTESCPYCVQLKDRLTKEPELVQLMTQYVAVELYTDEPDFAAWSQQFKPKGSGVPMVFIVSAQGQEVYNGSGAPQGDSLKQLLLRGIEQTGGIKQLITPDDIVKREKALTDALRVAKLMLARKYTAKAVEALVAVLPADESEEQTGEAGEKKPIAPQVEPSASQLAVDQLVSELTAEGQKELDAAVERAGQTGQELVGMVQLVRVKRIYGALPGLKESLEKVLAPLREDAEQDDMLTRAEAIDVARAFEDEGNRRQAVAAYEKVVADYPGTLAAHLSQTRIGQLSGPSSTAGSDTASTAPAGSDDSDSSVASSSVSSLKRADSYLRMARTFAESRPEKAREYAQKALDLVLPGTPQAQQAAELLRMLR